MVFPWFPRRAQAKSGAARYHACPYCGEPVIHGALACRACGSDAHTGWSEAADSHSLDLGPSGDAEDYEDFLAREFPKSQKSKIRVHGFARRFGFWLMIVVLVLALLLARV